MRMRADRLLLLAVLAIVSLGASLGIASSSIDDKTTKHSSRCFDTFLVTPVPDLAQDTLTTYLLNYIDYFGFPDPTVTADPDCGDLTLTVVGSGGPAGLAVNQSNAKLPTYSGTITAGASSGTITYSVDNANSAVTSDTAVYTVTAVAGSATPIPLDGASRFVKTAGNDALDGLTPTTAWRTLAKVNNTVLPTGTDVWFQAGDSFPAAQLVIDWSGTSTDRAIIGGYYVSGGFPYQNLPTNLLANPQDGSNYVNGARPKINGSTQTSCRPGGTGNVCPYNCIDPATAKNCALGTAVPSSRFSGLVSASSNTLIHHVTIQDLYVFGSAGRGIDLYYGGPGRSGNGGECRVQDTGCDTNNVLQRNKVEFSMTESINVSYQSRVVIRENESLHNVVQNDFAGFAGGSPLNSVAASEILWENNWMHDENADGLYMDSSFTLARGNRHSGIGRANMFPVGYPDVVVEQNLIIGGIGTDPNAPTNKQAFGPSFWNTFGGTEGLAVTDNNSGGGGRRHLFRSNLTASNGGALFSAYCGQDPMTAAAYPNIRCDVRNIGNTYIGAGTASYYQDWVYADNGNFLLTSKHRNNLIQVTAADRCTVTPNSVKGTKVTMAYNQWAIPGNLTPSDSGCRNPGTGDVYSTNTGLPGFGWSTVSTTNFPAVSDFIPAAAGAGVSAANASDYTATGYVDSSTNWDWTLAQRRWLPACNTTGAQVPKSEWIKDSATDYCGNPRDTTIGGINHAP